MKSPDRGVILIIIVAALGYFVDIYDLLLFSILRVSSLRSLHVPSSEVLSKGVLLINVQMAGLLLGGILWGVLGDKRGRLSVLFGSIFLYSAANIANAFVQTVPQYAVMRFIAGIGLAGELGAGITLVTESLPIRLRGYGTSVVAAVGLLGAVFAGLVGDFFTWRASFAIGGFMGCLILILRVSVNESVLFNRSKQTDVRRGDIFMLFARSELFIKYLAVIFIGIPIWFVVGILMTFTPELAAAFGMTDLPTAGSAVMSCYAGAALGDLLSGVLSQNLKSRKRVILAYMILTTGLILLHLRMREQSLTVYYGFCALLGFGSGYWAMFVTVAAEQFGTNLRATVSTTVPNVVRGCVIPLTLSFQFMSAKFGALQGASIIGGATMIMAFLALAKIEETYSKDLDYFEP